MTEGCRKMPNVRPSREVEGRRIEVRGTVQGVGFRPWVYRLAVEQELCGRVRNDARGVTIEVFGSPSALGGFRRRLEDEEPDDDGGGPPRRLHLKPHPAIEDFLLSLRRG